MDSINKIVVNGTTYSVGGGAVTSVVGQTGAVTASQIITALEAANYAPAAGGLSYSGSSTVTLTGTTFSLTNANVTTALGYTPVDYTETATDIQLIDSTIISQALRKTAQSLTSAEKLLARTNIDAEAKVDIVSAGGASLTAEVGKYYRYDSAVGTLAITLPVPSDTTHVSSIIFAFTTDSTTNVTFTSTATIKYKEGFEIESDTLYEINAIYNGSYWSLASIKLESA